MTLGPPKISIAGLDKLAATLASLGATRSGGAKSRPSRKKEKDDAKQATSKSHQLVLQLERQDLQVPAVKTSKGWWKRWRIFCWKL